MWIQHIILLCCVVLGVLGSRQPASAQGRSVQLDFTVMVHGKSDVVGSGRYTNRIGQTFTLSAVKYYLGHLTLERADGSGHFLADHVLIDAEDSTSGRVTLRDVPSGTYPALTFMVGVDSIHNTGGPLEGALDPLNGMYWTWATGFIFVKVEGSSPSSTQPKNVLEYHLGGFAHPYQNMRWVTLRFTTPLVVGTVAESLGVTFDVGTWLDACNIDFALQPTVTDVRSAGPMMDHISSAFRANR